MIRGSRLSRRRIRRGWAIGLLAGLVLLAGGILRFITLDRLQAVQPVDADIRGRLAVPLESGLSILELPALTELPLVSPETGASVTSAAWSPDGRSIAYGYFHHRPGDLGPSSEIYLISPSDRVAQVLVERDEPGAQLDFPTWTPDGEALFYSAFRREGDRFVNRIERFSLQTKQRTRMLEGYAPSLSPDGQTLVFLRDARDGPELWVAPIWGDSPRRLLPGTAFSIITSPRFSRDGLSIAFGGAAVAQASAAISDSAIGNGLVPTAFAHGFPSDLWSISLAGGTPKRLSSLGEDDPSVTWAPGGEHLAAFGPGGLYLLSEGRGSARKVFGRGSLGVIDWAPG